jgi:serine/threonine-protein kinase
MEVLAGFGIEGFADGAGAAAQFDGPGGVAVDGEGSIIIADEFNNRVRKVTPDGTVSTLAGSGSRGFADGAGAAAQFHMPIGVAVDGEGSIIIADRNNHRVCKLTPDGTVSTLAGSGSAGFADGAGAAAQFRYPGGVAVDGEGSIIIADECNHCVRKITPDGTVSTLAGSGSAGFADGAGAAAQFNGPFGVAVDGDGSFIITDSNNRRVRKVTPDGTVSTLAGSGSEGFADGAGAATQFSYLRGVAVDGEGSIIIADWGNKRVRKITPDGTVSTLAGSGSRGSADGAGAAAQFNRPYAFAVDGEGSIILAEYNNERLRKITPDGTVSTLFAGSCGFRGVAIDADGCVVVSTEEHTVAKIAGCRVAAPGAKRRLAFCMLSHERLGHGSIWAGLEQGLLQMVLCNKH